MRELKLYPRVKMFQSKMNKKTPRMKLYIESRKYLRCLIPDVWCNFNDLPSCLAFEIISLMDEDRWWSNRKAKWHEKDTRSIQKKTIINEFYTAFKVVAVE